MAVPVNVDRVGGSYSERRTPDRDFTGNVYSQQRTKHPTGSKTPFGAGMKVWIHRSEMTLGEIAAAHLRLASHNPTTLSRISAPVAARNGQEPGSEP